MIDAHVQQLTDEKLAQERLGYRRNTRRRNVDVLATPPPVNDERPLAFHEVGPLDDSCRRDEAIRRL